MPLCCQQRIGPCTRREHGVPFLVRAPQIYTSASIVFTADFEAAPGEAVDDTDCELLSGESARLSIISGGVAA